MKTMKSLGAVLALTAITTLFGCGGAERDPSANGGVAESNDGFQATTPVNGVPTAAPAQTVKIPNQGPVLQPALPGCSPPFTTPTYAQPATDSIAISSLLEGAGYGAATNSDWVDIASGNLCGGAEKELVLVKNEHSSFSIMRGPTPYAVAAFDNPSNAAHPWRAVAVGNLDGVGDEIVAVRKVTAAGVPDVFVMRADPVSCVSTQVASTGTIGNSGNSEWLDAAIGNFDGTGKRIALLKAAHSNFFLVSVSGNSLNAAFASDLDTNPSYPWKGIAAGDLDGDGIDELVATRKVSDKVGTTVLVYKWVRGTFQVVASSTIGNNGTSDWTGVTVGDFNGDKRAAIALTKNTTPNFAVLDMLPGNATLRLLKTSNLDGAGGSPWRGVTAVDWLGGDREAAELVAVRAAQAGYRADLLVYGNPFHRVMRDSGIADQRAEWDQPRGKTPAELVADLKDVHATTVSWTITGSDDYKALVAFLAADATKNTCIDGRRLRVSVTLYPKSECGKIGTTQVPCDNDETSCHELDFFAPNASAADICKDTLGWASLLGRLAQDYPQLVSVGIDDLSEHLDDYPEEELAEVQSRMRQQAPWLTFVSTTYYTDLGNIPPDYARTVDTLLFYFRNESGSDSGDACLADPCGTESVGNAPREFLAAAAMLPVGRKLQVGTYWEKLKDVPGEASNRYDYDLVRLARNLPWIGGVTAYPAAAITRTPDLVCNEFNVLDDEFCTLQRVFGTKPQPVSYSDLTSASGAPPAAGNPFTYVFPSHDVQNVIYRGTDNHAHELWRTSSGIGHSDLTALAGAPNVVGDPTAYVFPEYDYQNVVYRGTDNNIHGLWWSWGAVGHDNLTVLANAPQAAGNPYGYVFPALGNQNVLYRGVDGHLHGLWWALGAVGHDDLTSLSGAPGPAGDPFGYVFDAIGMQNALYRGNDGRVHDLWWSTGAVGNDDLTSLSQSPAPAGNPKAYIATTYGQQIVVYRGSDGHVHDLNWSTGAVGHDDLTNDSKAPGPIGDPTGYFTTSDGRHHVVYRSADGHVRALSWTLGFVTHDDLTNLAYLKNPPLAASDPAAYQAPDGSQHVIYRSADGRLHDLTFRN